MSDAIIKEDSVHVKLLRAAGGIPMIKGNVVQVIH